MTGPSPAVPRLLPWVLALVVLTTLTRLPSLLYPRAIDDEEVHALVANTVVDGGRLYVDVAENKPPLLFWTYAGVFSAAGEYDWFALHLTALLWTLLTMLGLYALVRSLFDPGAGLIAALLYSVFQPWATWKNLAFSGELLMNLPIVWGAFLVLRPSGSKTRLELLGAGALLCAGFLLKQPAAIAAVPLGLYLLLPAYRRDRQLTPLQSIAHASLLTAGFFGTLGLVALRLRHDGILSAAYDNTIGGYDVPYFFWARAAEHSLAFLAACAPLTIGAAYAIRAGDARLPEPGPWSSQRPEFLALIGLLIASAIGVAAGGRFYPHYFIQLVPPMAILAAPVFARTWVGQEQPRAWFRRPRLMQAWIGLAAAGFLVAHARVLRPHPPPTEAGAYLAAHASPQDRLFVWGRVAAIYLDSRLKPASRYIGNAPLTGYIFGAPLPGVNTDNRIRPGSWEMLGRELAARPPAFIVDAEAANPQSQYPAARYPQLAGLLAHDYREVYRAREGIIYQRIGAAVAP